MKTLRLAVLLLAVLATQSLWADDKPNLFSLTYYELYGTPVAPLGYAQGNPNAVFIFKAASTLITASASNVKLVNGAKAANVFWQVGSSATLGTYSTLRGNILALASITITTGVTVHGRALARTAAVTLDTDTITK